MKNDREFEEFKFKRYNVENLTDNDQIDKSYEEITLYYYDHSKYINYKIDLNMTSKRLELMRRVDKTSLYGFVRVSNRLGLKKIDQIMLIIAEYLMATENKEKTEPLERKKTRIIQDE